MFVDAPPEAFAESLREVLPAWQIDGLLEDYAHYARGEAATVHSTVAEVTGHQPRTSISSHATTPALSSGADTERGTGRPVVAAP